MASGDIWRILQMGIMQELFGQSDLNLQISIYWYKPVYWWTVS